MTDPEILQQFKDAVQSHDVSYEYSDDHQVRLRGSAQLFNIKTLAEKLPREVAVQIWNERMDKYFIASEAPRWYWKVFPSGY